MEFRENVLSINAKNEKRVRPNMVFNLTISLKDLVSKGKKYSIKIADTVLINSVKEAGDAHNVILTSDVTSKYENVAFTLDLDEQDVRIFFI